MSASRGVRSFGTSIVTRRNTSGPPRWVITTACIWLSIPSIPRLFRRDDPTAGEHANPWRGLTIPDIRWCHRPLGSLGPHTLVDWVGRTRLLTASATALSLKRAVIRGGSIEATVMPQTETGTTLIQFGHCRLFANRRELVVDGVAVPLGSRAFDVLPMLVEAPRGLVPQDVNLSPPLPGGDEEKETLPCPIARVCST